MHVQLLHVQLLQLLSCARRAGTPSLKLTVCNSGSCAENGAELLQAACEALGSGSPHFEVASCYCTGECPQDGVMVCPKRNVEEPYSAPAFTLEQAIASAAAAIAAGGEAQVLPGVERAFALLIPV